MSGLRSIENFVNPTKLKELAEKGQSPFAIVLTCSDSRIPTEIIFDQGFGDLFVIRVAGNVVAPSIIGSIEFAASSFGTPLCVVMGHSQCGAVKAAVHSEMEHQETRPSNVDKVISKVRPAVQTVINTLGRPSKSLDSEKLIYLSTVENVYNSAHAITRKSPIIQELVDKKKLSIVSALYDLHTGEVDFNLPTLETFTKKVSSY